MQGCIHLESIRRYYIAFYWGNCFRATAHHWCKQISAIDLSEYLHCAKMMETWEALWHWGPVLSGPGLSWLTVAKQRIRKDEERGTGIIRNAIVRKSQSDSNKVAATGLLPRTARLIRTKIWTGIILWSRHAYRLIIQFFVILRPCYLNNPSWLSHKISFIIIIILDAPWTNTNCPIYVDQIMHNHKTITSSSSLLTTYIILFPSLDSNLSARLFSGCCITSEPVTTCCESPGVYLATAPATAPATGPGSVFPPLPVVSTATTWHHYNV